VTEQSEPTMAPNPEIWGGRMVKYYEAMRAWGAVGSAVSALIAFFALLFLIWQFDHAQTQWRRDAAIRAILGGSASQSYISRHCLGALSTFSPDQLRDIHNRKKVDLNQEQAEWTERCFADLTDAERNQAYDKSDNSTSLSANGEAKLAQRANRSLNNDELITEFVLQGIADETLLRKQYGQRICSLDKPLVEKLQRVGHQFDIEEWKDLFQSILDFAADRCT
jgi:hypothetical protein